MEEISILIGGKAGEGIKQGGNLLARLFNRYGWFVFVYEDYPSLIRGGHNFAIIRASKKPVKIHREMVDVIFAFNKETLKIHQNRIGKDTIIVCDTEEQERGIRVSMNQIIQEQKLPIFTKNAMVLGMTAKLLNINFRLVKNLLVEVFSEYQKENIKAAEIGYKLVPSVINLSRLRKPPKPLLTGNEAIALGAAKAGLKLYVAYPMTPATSILHFFANHQNDLGVRVVQPENEIAAALIAEGAAYAGVRSMVGTSGGGFALMNEALSMAGQAEIPVLFVLSQRAAPSTGVPTYTMQADLLFALNAGHGEFQRIVAAPGDTEQAFRLTGEVLDLVWKYQMPGIILSDKHLSESTFSSEIDLRWVKMEKPKIWQEKRGYKRYLVTEDGISPLAFPGTKNNIVKATSYEHDEYGITTEDPKRIEKMIEKRAKKRESLINELKKKETVKVYGNKKSKKVLIGWGSTQGVLQEVAEKLKIKFVQIIYLEPFPKWELEKILKDAVEIIDVETNSTGQLATVLKANGFNINHKILKYNARPFTLDELIQKLWQVIK